MIFVVEDFELDEALAELRWKGSPVAVEPQVFELIKLLISLRGRVVTKDELFEQIWKNRFVSDASLSSCIRDARKALNDDGTTQRLIRTVHRRGFRFVGEVLEKNKTSAATRQQAELVGDQNPNADDILSLPAVAVLPFETTSADEKDRYLAEGLSDEVTSSLSAWRHFPVVSSRTLPNSISHDIDQTATSSIKGVRYILSGKFRRLGNRIKLNITLTDTETNRLIWSERISRDIGDLVDLEQEISAQVVALVSVELEGAEARRIMRKPASDLTAWEMVMRASWIVRQGGDADFALAERLATDAIERAPDWTMPYTLIAFTKFQQAMNGFSGSDTSVAFSRTLKAAKYALEIDRNSWMAHALTAVGELWTNRNHERALLHIDRAIELNPSGAINYHIGGCINGFSGNPEAARDHQERLFRLDPVYPYTAVIQADLGLWHLLDMQLPEADERLSSAHKWNPKYGRALQRQISLAGLQGDRDRASAAARKLSELGMSLNYDYIAASYPFRNPDHGELFLDGLRRSGINY